jgi:hypothetical protein
VEETLGEQVSFQIAGAHMWAAKLYPDYAAGIKDTESVISKATKYTKSAKIFHRLEALIGINRYGQDRNLPSRCGGIV